MSARRPPEIAAAGLSGIAGAAPDESVPFAWGAIHADRGYAADTEGDPRSADGARVVVRSTATASAPFGGAIGSVDGAPLRGLRIVIDAELAPTVGTSGAAIWLRVDDAARKPLEFASSVDEPVPAASTAPRSLALQVPTKAHRVVFGVTLRGAGSVTASRYRLRVDADATIASDVTPRRVLDEAVEIVRRDALKAGAVDWAAAQARYRAIGEQAKVPADVYSAIREMLASLNDGHSFFVRPDDAKKHAQTGRETSPARVERRGDGIGYVRMPGFIGTNAADQTAFARRVSAEIDDISTQVVCGWIVDLRDDDGGNLWPMLAALRALLGDDEVGGFRHGDGTTVRWRAGNRVDDLATTADLRDAHVAVVLGPRTSSSGEAAAVAFHGRPNTRSFGRPTSGQANANTTYTLPDDSQINLSTAIDVDRHGVAFGEKVPPDVVVNDDGAVLDTAAAWLAAQRP